MARYQTQLPDKQRLAAKRCEFYGLTTSAATEGNTSRRVCLEEAGNPVQRCARLPMRFHSGPIIPVAQVT